MLGFASDRVANDRIVSRVEEGAWGTKPRGGFAVT